MKKLFFAIVVSSVVVSALAATNNAFTAAERAEHRAKALARVGGLLPMPGTPSGRILLVNAQKRVPTEEIKTAFYLNCRQLKGAELWKDDSTPIGLGNVAAYLKSNKAKFGVFIVDDPTLPMSLLALEAGWGFVNVAAMAVDKPKQDLLTHRTKVEFARVFGILCGGISSQFQSRVMNAITKPSDLNTCTAELPVDTCAKLSAYCETRGVKGVKFMPYRRACEQGWAPAPTNDIQKAIWDKVHAIPKNPMKIEFDPKKGR